MVVFFQQLSTPFLGISVCARNALRAATWSIFESASEIAHCILGIAFGVVAGFRT